jgi:hypothetical protein
MNRKAGRRVLFIEIPRITCYHAQQFIASSSLNQVLHFGQHSLKCKNCVCEYILNEPVYTCFPGTFICASLKENHGP